MTADLISFGQNFAMAPIHPNFAVVEWFCSGYVVLSKVGTNMFEVKAK